MHYKSALGAALAVITCVLLFAFSASITAQEPSKRLVETSIPNVSECLVPLEVEQAEFGNFGGFRNTCPFLIEYTVCVENPKEDSWSSTTPCILNGKTNNIDHVGPNGRSAAHIYGGSQAHWFACRHSFKSGEGPDGIRGAVIFDGKDLRGSCKQQSYQVVEAPRKLTPTPPANMVNTAPSVVPPELASLHASALGGDPQAQYRLAEAYRKRAAAEARASGKPEDRSTYLGWYEKSATAGYAPSSAAYGLLLYLENREAEAVPFLEKGAPVNRNAKYLFANMLWNGDGGLTRDTAKARILMQEAAAEGSTAARDELAKMGPAASTQVAVAPAVAPVQAAKERGGLDKTNSTDLVWAACQNEAREYVDSKNARGPGFAGLGDYPMTMEKWRSRTMSSAFLSVSMEALQRSVASTELDVERAMKNLFSYPEVNRYEIASARYFYCVAKNRLALRQ